MITKHVVVACALAAALAASPAAATETLAVSFLTPDAAVTTDLYSGYVKITVSGSGNSYFQIANDAFYLYDNKGYYYTPDHYYQLAISTAALVSGDTSHDAYLGIAGGAPSPHADHTYTFVYNTGTATPSHLHFGIADADYTDNGGSLTLTVAQVPEPAAWTMMIGGFGLVGGALRSRRKPTVAFAPRRECNS